MIGKGALLFVSRWLRRLVIGLIGLVLLYQLWLLAWVFLGTWVNPDTTSFMEIRLAELRAKNPKAELQKQWVGYAKISPHLKRALIVSEDGTFVHHEGFDWEGMQKAMEKNQRRGKIVAGGSTISQQLAKNLLLDAVENAVAQGVGGGDHADDRKPVEQAAHLRGLFERDRVGQWCVRRRSGGAPLLWHRRRAVGPDAGGTAGRHGAESALLRPQPQCARSGAKASVILACMPAAEIP